MRRLLTLLAVGAAVVAAAGFAASHLSNSGSSQVSIERASPPTSATDAPSTSSTTSVSSTVAPNVESQSLDSTATTVPNGKPLFRLKLKLTIWGTKESGPLSSKSVVALPSGKVIAQNMMYTHGVTVYSNTGQFLARVSDSVSRSMLGLKGTGTVAGSPVEASYSPDGAYAYVSNYQMFGRGFNKPGQDDCNAEDGYDKSYIYKIDMSTYKVVAAARVGAVPKYLKVTPDNTKVLVSNWCSASVSVVDLATFKQVKEITVGRHPRGIAITKDSKRAYVAVMGGYKVWNINLQTYRKTSFQTPRATPRHLLLSPDEKLLYISHNVPSLVAVVNAKTGRLVKSVFTGNQPRTMALSPDGKVLYVVNYADSTMSVVNTETMKVTQQVKTPYHPIGVTYETTRNRVWLASYRGQLLVYEPVAK